MQPADPKLVGRWLAYGAAGFTVLSLAVAAVVASGGGPACAAPIPSAGRAGTASFFSMGDTLDNCSYPQLPQDDLFAALPAVTYANAVSCGTYLELTGPRGKVRVLMLDRCADCSAERVDLSRAAFERLADPELGVIKVQVRTLVDPDLPGPLTLRLKADASPDYFALLVSNHGNALSKVEVEREPAKWLALSRTGDNYWVAANGLGNGPFRVRVTDSQGHQVTISGLAMKPGVSQKTSAWMYAGPAAQTTPSRSPARRSEPLPARSSGGQAPLPTLDVFSAGSAEPLPGEGYVIEDSAGEAPPQAQGWQYAPLCGK